MNIQIWNICVTNSKEDFVTSKRVSANNKQEIVDYVKSTILNEASADFSNVEAIKFGTDNRDNYYSSAVRFKDRLLQVVAFKDAVEEAPEQLQCLAFGDNSSLRVVATFANANDMGEELYDEYVGSATSNDGRMDIRVADGYKFVTIGNTVLLLEEV